MLNNFLLNKKIPLFKRIELRGKFAIIQFFWAKISVMESVIKYGGIKIVIILVKKKIDPKFGVYFFMVLF